MITLTDRANGSLLCSLNPEEFAVFQRQLVLESEQDFDYYLNDSTLEMLAEAGLPTQAVEILAGRMRHRGLDVGWEHLRDGARTVSGSVVDAHVHPLGGVRVDLLHGSTLLGWTYARSDGTFSLATNSETSGLSLRFLGRGDLVLRQQSVSGDGDQGQFELQTVSGLVTTESGEPLSGVNVLLADWRSSDEDWHESTSWSGLGGQRSWSDSDEEGRFAIPVNLPEDAGELEIELELTTVEGQTLEVVVLTVDPENGFQAGTITAPPQEALEAEPVEVAE